MKTMKSLIVAASVSLALAFTFSCSSDSNGGGEQEAQTPSSSVTANSGSSSSVTSSEVSSSSAASSSSYDDSSGQAPLFCTGLQETVERGGTIAEPTLTCSNGNPVSNVSWTGRPNQNSSWTTNAASQTASYTIGATANCGSGSQAAECGTVTVVNAGTTPSSSSIAASSSSQPSSSSVTPSSSSQLSSSSVAASSSSQPSSSSTTVPATCTATRSKTTLTYGTRNGSNQSHLRNVLDLTLPSSGNGPFPLIVWIHGGGFSGGSKNDISSPFSEAPNRGYAFASINYTLSGEGKFPMGVEDALAAIRFLRANATQYCINPDKIGVTGFSAGGYYTAIVAALSGVNGHEFDNADLGNAGVSSKVQAAVGWSGLTDFARLDQINDVSGALQHCGISSPEGQLLGCDPCAASCANSPKSNPLNYITAENCADLPPIMMEHGKKDNLVPWKSAEIFVDKINQTCGAGRAVGNYYENGNHGTGLGNATVIFTNFLDVHLK